MNPQMYPYPDIPQQQQQYQQPPPMTYPGQQQQQQSQPINQAPQPQQSARRCSRRGCQGCKKLKEKLFSNPQKSQKFALIASWIMACVLCFFSVGAGIVIAIVPKIVGLVLGFVAIRRKGQAVLGHGIFFGFQFFSMMYTLALGFNGLVPFILALVTLVGEGLTLVLSRHMALKALRELQVNLGEDSNAEDVVEEENQQIWEEQQPSQQQPEQYQQQPEQYSSVYPSQPQQYQPTYQPQPAPVPQKQQQQQPQQTNSNDEALFQKYEVPLGLLAEMNFAKNYEEKVRNAHLLEKYNGNIQAVVAEIVSQ